MDREKMSLEELINSDDMLKNKISCLEEKINNDHYNRYNRLKNSNKAKDILLNLHEPKKRIPLIKDKNGKLVIPRGKVGLLVAAGGSGKTQLLLQLVVSLATDSDWLNTFPVGEAEGKILFISGEEEEEDIYYRLHHFLKNSNVPYKQREKIVEKLDILDVSGLNNSFLSSENSFDKILNELIKEHTPSEGWSLIILDPASRFLPKDGEIDNFVATKFISECEKLKNIPGNPTILITHHVNKSSIGTSKLFSDEFDSNQGASRGASALVDGVRFVINIDTIVKEDWLLTTELSNKKLLKIRHSKINHGPFMQAVNAVIDEHGIIYALDPSTEEQLKIDKSNFKGVQKKTKNNLSDINTYSPKFIERDV